MSVIDRIDARARRWPRPLTWAYLALRWLLILLGVYLIIGLAVIELSERRLGLGTGVLTVVILATIKGVILANQRD